MTGRPVMRATWGGTIGRGYAIYRDGQRITAAHYSPDSAWSQYRRDQRAALTVAVAKATR